LDPLDAFVCAVNKDHRPSIQLVPDSTMTSKSKQEEALRFLDDLDSLSPPPASVARGLTTPGAEAAHDGEAADVLALIDEITQKSAEPTRATTAHLDRPLSRSGTPTVKKGVERVRVGTPGTYSPSTPSLPTKAEASTTVATSPKTTLENTQEQGSVTASSSNGWGWGSVWSTAAAALQQAKSAVDEQVKNLPNEQARKWSEGVIEYAKTAQLDKLGKDFKRVGLSTLNDILNVVAPPISEHEVIHVWLSHDMRGYDGIETLVYRALARIMEQVEGGDLIVNSGKQSRPKDMADGSRELNAVESYEAAHRLAQANLDELIKENVEPPTHNPSSPVTYSNIYIRVQPFMAAFSLPDQHPGSQQTAAATTQSHLQFILHLSDPAHNLTHTTVTQAVPGTWMELWDQYDWVEDLVAETLRVGVEVLGQDYIVARMGWGNKQKEAEKASEEDSDYSIVNEKIGEA